MDSFTCEYCLDIFKTQNLLLKHSKNAKNCITYMDILFTCKKCNYKTVGIKNIDKHIVENTCIDKIYNDNINDYIIDEDSIDGNMQNNISESNNYKLENALKIEKIKNIIYKSIIEQNIPIKLDNILNENEHVVNIFECGLNNIGIHIFKNAKGDIYVKTDLKDKETKQFIEQHSPYISDHDSIDNNEKNIKSFKSYKIFKSNCIELASEPVKIILDNKIREVDIDIYNIKRSFITIDQAKIIFKKCFEEIKNNRTYIKYIDEIRKTRIKLLGTLLVTEYIQILNDQVKMLENILVDKGHNPKKITNVISKSLNSLDSRLLLYGNYFDIPMDIEEVSKFRICLDLSIKLYNYHTPFNFTDSIKSFFNYGTVLSSVKMCIEMYLINRYGFNNIVYIPLKQSSEEDPYSFYILENVIKDKRYWKMDCRLVDLSDSIISNIKPYLINIFKKIYQDIFSDNDYRENYYTKTEITGNDFEQLLCNIFTLSDTFKFYNIMRNIIKKNATYIPTENDKINIFGDDLIIKKRFSTIKESIDKTDIVKSIFDNITNEQAVDLYRSKISSF